MKAMKIFLHIVGAIAIGLLFAGSITFPVLAIGVVIGYFVIQEAMSGNKSNTSENQVNTTKFSGVSKIFEDTREGTW